MAHQPAFNVLLALAVTSIVIANASFSVYQDYHVTVEDHEGMVRDLTSVVAEQTKRTVESADLSLRQISEVIQAGGSLNSLTKEPQWSAFRRISQRIEGSIGVLVADMGGRVVAVSTGLAVPTFNVTDRQYMKVLAENDVLDIGPAVRSRVKPGEMVYTVSRRLVDADSNLIGVASASISTSYLTDFYDLLGFQRDPLIVVCRPNGEIMARRPNLQEFIGKSLANTPLFQWRIKQAPEGVFRATNPLTGVPYLFSYKLTGETGMLVLTGIEWDIVIGKWRSRTVRTSSLAAFSVVIILTATWWGMRLSRKAVTAQADRDAAVRAKDIAHDALNDARRDHLTGLPARALFLEEAQKIQERCRNGTVSMAIMIIDLDGFKVVNDTYGHDKGDEVLIDAAHILQATLRDTDVAGRLGGDEFGVVLVGSQQNIGDIATKVAERIVAVIGDIGYGIGCSVGVTLCPIVCQDLNCAFRRADEAMYVAKRGGKNRFVVWGELDIAWQKTDSACC